MDTVTRDSVVVRREDLLTTDMDGETVMMSIEHGRYYGLNELGAHTWELLRQPVGVDRICRQLESEFDVSPSDCESAVLAFLSQLARNGLISTTQ